MVLCVLLLRFQLCFAAAFSGLAVCFAVVLCDLPFLGFGSVFCCCVFGFGGFSGFAVKCKAVNALPVHTKQAQNDMISIN